MTWLSRWLGSGATEPASLPSSADRMADTRSRDGHVREAAVRALGASVHGPALPLLLERANDWVPEVRQAAREIAAFLLSPDHVVALKAAGTGMTREATRFLFALELGHATDEEARFRLLRNAATSADVVIAATAIAGSESLQMPSHRIALAGAACRSPFASIRADGLRAALRTGDASTASLVRALCADNSASVRAVALAALGDDRGRVLEEARRALHDGRSATQRAVALDVVCALDSDAVVALCEDALTDPAAAIRCIAFARLFARARDDDRDALVVAALADASSRLRDLSVAQVRKGAFAPPPDVLRAIVTARVEALGHAIRIAGHASPWARLSFLLDASTTAADGSQPRRLLVANLERVDRDLERAFVQPSAEQERTLAQAWRQARDRLPVPLQRRLALHLKASGQANSES